MTKAYGNKLVRKGKPNRKLTEMCFGSHRRIMGLTTNKRPVRVEDMGSASSPSTQNACSEPVCPHLGRSIGNKRFLAKTYTSHKSLLLQLSLVYTVAFYRASKQNGEAASFTAKRGLHNLIVRRREGSDHHMITSHIVYMGDVAIQDD